MKKKNIHSLIHLFTFQFDSLSLRTKLSLMNKFVLGRNL